MKKEYIIPIFVPHLGCPNSCTFCNQKTISGQAKQVTAKEVKETIEYYLSNFKDNNKYINNNNKGYQGKKNTYQGRDYPPGYLDKLYANYNLSDDSVEDHKKSNGITNLNDLIENND